MNDTELEKVGEQVIRKRGRPKGSGGNTREDKSLQPTEPGANREIILKTMRLWNLPKIDVQNTEEVSQRINEYFSICAEEDLKPSVEGLAFALGIQRQYLYDLRVGNRGKNEEVAFLLKRAVEYLNMSLVEYMANGKINPIPAIFLLKNHYGYADKQEVVVTPNNPLGENTPENALESRYSDSVVIDQ